PRTALAMGACLAFLPWLNVRYTILTFALLTFALAARPAARVALLWVGPSIVSAFALALFHFHLYGFFDPRRVYGRRPELTVAGLPTGLPGLLFDQEFGPLASAPLLALAVPAFPLLWPLSRPRAVVAPVCRAAAGAEEWTRLLPGYVLDQSQPDRARLTLVWSIAIAGAVVLGRSGRVATPAGLAAAGLGLVVAAGVASRLSTAH